MDSILTTIKLMLGIPENYKHFDNSIITHINTVLMTLSQIGVGPKDPVLITSEIDFWEKVLGEVTNLEAVKTYVYLKVRVLFDPPASSTLLESLNRQASEFEWRLNVQSENKEG